MFSVLVSQIKTEVKMNLRSIRKIFVVIGRLAEKQKLHKNNLYRRIEKNIFIC